MPLDQTILQLKAIGAKDILKFPFVTMPPRSALRAALRHLTILGALDIDAQKLENLLRRDGDIFLQNDLTDVNNLGKLLSKIPISPKFGKMLVVASKYKVTKFAIMIVACMSVPELFSEIEKP
jgi:ATP-dependent RNA helicase DHX37/DHR1